MPLELIHNVENETRKSDSLELLPLMEKWTGYASYKVGTMIGFGQYHYRYDSGREGDFFVTGFSPRKQNLAIYIMPGLAKYPELLEKLGKHKLGKSCLYVNKLADIDLSILERLVVASVEDMQAKYECIDVGRV
jgi:hypothetical protein